MLVSCNNQVVDNQRIDNQTTEKTKEAYNDTIQTVVDAICSYYSIKDFSKWKLELAQADEITFMNYPNNEFFGGEYYFNNIEGDTISRIVITYYVSPTDTQLVHIDYYKFWIEKDKYKQHVILFGEGADTLFHYWTPLFGKMRKYFERGIYHYEYKFYYFKLSEEQREYYEQHRDSLNRIKWSKGQLDGILE